MKGANGISEGRKAEELCKRLSKGQLWEESKEHERSVKALETGQQGEGAPVQTCCVAALSNTIFLSMTESYFSKLKKKEPGMFY